MASAHVHVQSGVTLVQRFICVTMLFTISTFSLCSPHAGLRSASMLSTVAFILMLVLLSFVAQSSMVKATFAFYCTQYHAKYRDDISIGIQHLLRCDASSHAHSKFVCTSEGAALVSLPTKKMTPLRMISPSLNYSPRLVVILCTQILPTPGCGQLNQTVAPEIKLHSSCA